MNCSDCAKSIKKKIDRRNDTLLTAFLVLPRVFSQRFEALANNFEILPAPKTCQGKANGMLLVLQKTALGMRVGYSAAALLVRDIHP